MTDPVLLAAHGRHAQAVVFTRSGRLLLSAGQDKQIRLWSVPGFHAVGSIIGHKNSVNSLSFSPDESLLATSSSDGTVRVWSFPGGQQDRILDKQVAARFSPSGRWIATLSAKARVSLWAADASTPSFTSEPVDRRAFSLEFSPDEHELLVGGTGAIHRLALPDGTSLGSLPAHEMAVAALAVSPDRTVLASTGYPGVLRLWSAGDWAPLAEIPLDGMGVMAVAFSPDSREISVSIDFHIVTVSVAKRAITGRRRVGAKGVYGLAYSPDGKYLANACADGRIRVWTLK